MSRAHFGTDGVRGVANARLTPELALKLGQAAGRYISEQGLVKRAVIGRDTRRSGPLLTSALASGLSSAGIDVVTLDVVPTPTVSFVARTGEFGIGAVVSASHNPAPDNGIKFVGHDGRKLTDDVELEIEALMMGEYPDRPVGAAVGDVRSDRSSVDQYLAYLESICSHGLKGLRVAVDGSNGAAFELGPEILRRLGADVVVVANCPDGMNINAECGATHPSTICAFTVESRADVGVAFDGDADRAIFSDERGTLINGDRTMGAWSVNRQARGQLDPAVVVGTVMSNGGFEAYLAEKSIRLERAPVGDKYVAERMRDTRAAIGGEQSGHLIFSALGPTGDGLITMLEFFGVLVDEGRPASSIVADYEPWPQVLVNVSLPSLAGWDQGREMQDVLATAKETLGSNGRVVVRPSGTQPMIRVMVEAESQESRDVVADRIVGTMQDTLGGQVYSRVDLTHALGD